MLPKLPGSTQQKQCQALMRHLTTYYAQNPSVPGKYSNLTVSMLKNKSDHKLRGRGGEVRGVISFVKQMSLLLLDPAIPFEATILEASKELESCYNCLSAATPRADLPEHARKFAVLNAALQNECTEVRGDFKLFRCKPKLHLLLELAEFSLDRPSDHWCYRDEDFGGSVSNISRRRGGANEVYATGSRVLQKFCSNFKVPRFARLRQNAV